MSQIHRTPAELEKALPYMFLSSGHLGYFVAKGWFPTFEKLCRDIDSVLGMDKRGFHWAQLKEKFGVPRWYYQFAPGHGGAEVVFDLVSEAGVLTFQSAKPPHDDVQGQVRTLKSASEREAGKLCLACGEPGDVGGQEFGWLLCLCPVHSQERQRMGEEIAQSRKKLDAMDSDDWNQPDSDYAIALKAHDRILNAWEYRDDQWGFSKTDGFGYVFGSGPMNEPH